VAVLRHRKLRRLPCFILYAVGLVDDHLVPKSIDVDGPTNVGSIVDRLLRYCVAASSADGARVP
jgi:hypothetical protein